MEPESDIECALSGVQPKEEDLVHDAEDDDPLEDMPVGWLRISIARREFNPDWVAIQECKRATAEAQLKTQVPPEHQSDPAALKFVQIQVDAMFAALEAKHDKYVTRDVEVDWAPAASNTQIQRKVKELCKLLGVSESVFLGE